MIDKKEAKEMVAKFSAIPRYQTEDPDILLNRSHVGNVQFRFTEDSTDLNDWAEYNVKPWECRKNACITFVSSDGEFSITDMKEKPERDFKVYQCVYDCSLLSEPDLMSIANAARHIFTSPMAQTTSNLFPRVKGFVGVYILRPGEKPEEKK